jgi:hypothetical protein
MIGTMIWCARECPKASRRYNRLNFEPLAVTYIRGKPSEAVMTHWRHTMVDRRETDSAFDVTGWTISGLAVLGAVVAVWIFGI